ncbi:transposase [Propionispira raffinosivorans]|uniref:transposase n=1 Tax=Propionispira raffinosivorans TaxID=86959 RepID=UPI00039BB0F1|nr:transposase [Propionispira raffinosivorans]
MREMMKNYLKDTDLRIQDGSDVKNIMRDMMSVLLEGAIDGELDDSFGYNKYDYKNKDTGNSRNGYSNKIMHTSYGDMEMEIPRDRKGEYELQIIKNIKIPLLRIWKKKLFLCMQKE